jgi:CHAT domain-containing protein/tetratricopeptide (TPR) repeat protein
LLRKAAPILLIALAAPAALLIASTSQAFAQSQSIAKRGEASFQEALISFDAGDRVSLRLRLEEAIRLWSQINEPAKAAKAALQIGDRFKQARQYRDALDYYNEALKVKSLPGLLKAKACQSIALVYAELYQADLALRNYNLALNQARAIDDPSAEMTVLTGLADFYHRQGDVKKSLDCIAQARRLSEKGSAVVDPALLFLQGRVSQKQGSVEKAKAAYEEALAIYRKTGNAEGQVRALCAISDLVLLSSQKQAALEKALQALELADKQARRSASQPDRARARELQWLAWLCRARAERVMGKKASAAKSYWWAINHFEGMWWARSLITEASALAFREEAQAGYKEYIDLLIEQEQFKDAYNYAEQAKSRVTLNFTEARRAASPAKDSDQETFLRDRSQAITRLRLELLSSNITPEQEAKLEKKIEDTEYEKQEKLVLDEMEHYRDRLVWSKLAIAEELEKQMAQDQTALAQFSLGEDRSFVWLFTRGEAHFAILPARKEIEREVNSYLDAIAAAPNPLFIEKEIAKARSKGEALFTTLFGSLSAQLEPGLRLIVVPDGLLHYLPFEALLHNGRYLVEDHEISYNPSASFLYLWEGSGGRSDNADQMELLAIGDPVFEGYSPKRSRAVARGFGFMPLPRTRDEVQYISGLFPTDRRKLLLGKESTEAAIKREALRRYRRLHFATHSLIDEQSPWRSGVVLTSGGEEDGFLDLREISRLDLDCDLVVVSACQTGRGKLLSGEGVIGLSRAFLYAGARAVIVSLWNVTDISTGQLMKSFYQHVTDGSSNVASLRRAKLQMIGGGKVTRHPYYWSSFVMIGKP